MAVGNPVTRDVEEYVKNEFARVKNRVEKSLEELEILREDCLGKIEVAKNNEILTAIQDLGKRLTALEQRIPEPEAPEPG